MKTKLKTSTKLQKQKSKLVKGFSIIGGKVNTTQDYYRLKYPKLYLSKRNKKNYFYKSNFRNSQNYVVGDYMKFVIKNSLKKKGPLKIFFNKLFYFLFNILLISLIFYNHFNEKIISFILYGLGFIIGISFLDYLYKKLFFIKNHYKYKLRGKKIKSKNLFIRININDKTYVNDFVIIQKK